MRDNFELGIMERVDQRELLETSIKNLDVLIHGCKQAINEATRDYSYKSDCEIKTIKKNIQSTCYEYMAKREEKIKLYRHLYS